MLEHFWTDSVWRSGESYHLNVRKRGRSIGGRSNLAENSALLDVFRCVVGEEYIAGQ